MYCTVPSAYFTTTPGSAHIRPDTTTQDEGGQYAYRSKSHQHCHGLEVTTFFMSRIGQNEGRGMEHFCSSTCDFPPGHVSPPMALQPTPLRPTRRPQHAPLRHRLALLHYLGLLPSPVGGLDQLLCRFSLYFPHLQNRG